MEWADLIFPFRRDGEGDKEPEKPPEPKEPPEPKKKRRLVPEQERTFYFFGWLVTLQRWDPEVFLDLPSRPSFYADFGDLVMSIAVTGWPGEYTRDWPP